jgi:hypothetical protein
LVPTQSLYEIAESELLFPELEDPQTPQLMDDIAAEAEREFHEKANYQKECGTDRLLPVVI